jgi:hypothetical protein
MSVDLCLFHLMTFCLSLANSGSMQKYNTKYSERLTNVTSRKVQKVEHSVAFIIATNI